MRTEAQQASAILADIDHRKGLIKAYFEASVLMDNRRQDFNKVQSLLEVTNDTKSFSEELRETKEALEEVILFLLTLL